MPPSKMGIGKRLKIARFKLTVAIKLMKEYGPSRAASPLSCAIPIGPSSDFAEEASFDDRTQELIDERRAFDVLVDRFLDRSDEG